MPKRLYRPSGFFVLRTPLLPFRYVEPLARGDEETIRELLADPVVREAIYLASPSLHDGIEVWLREPTASRAKGVKEAVIRYLLRAASRPTPFGLFAGIGTGTVGNTTDLHVPPRSEWRRHTRLDMGYLSAVADALTRDPSVRRQLTWYPNDALARVGNRYRHPVADNDESAGRVFHFTETEASSELDAILFRARSGASLDDLLVQLLESGHAREDAEPFLQELIDAQLLVSTLAPSVQSAAPAKPLEPFAPSLRTAHEALAALDRRGIGASVSSYTEIARTLDSLPAPPRRDRLFHVDLYKPSEQLSLGSAPLNEVLRGVELLARLRRASTAAANPLLRFIERFRRRYEMRAVPLLEVLDEGDGLGFDGSSRPEHVSPLLDAIALPSKAEEVADPDAYLLRRSLYPAGIELELTDDDIAALKQSDSPPLPDALSVLATMASSSPCTLARGEFLVRILSVVGPSGAQLLGRFCNGDPRLEAGVREHLRLEETLRPDALFAEILHLPEGRLGNILCRPANLRKHVLPYLAGAPSPGILALPLHDIDVLVRDDRVRLRSRSENREVLPRLASAHNYMRSHLAIYRFLAAVGSQDSGGGLHWPVGDAHFRPRLRHRRLVLDVARWQLPGSDLLAALGSSESIADFRARWHVPRWVVLADGDNELPLDLTQTASIHILRSRALREPRVVLEELWPPPDYLFASGPDGIFRHEVIVPLVRDTAPRTDAPSEAPAAPSTVQRTFLPGSEWLYAKIYVSEASSDKLLLHTIAPFVETARQHGIDRWFFIRYADPDPHIRIRLHGVPTTLCGSVLPLLNDFVQSSVRDGIVTRLELATYEREIERYGGPDCIELAESHFALDSDATLTALELLRDRPDGNAQRFAYALTCMRLILDDFSEPDRRHIAEAIYDGYLREHGGSVALKRSVSRWSRDVSVVISPPLEMCAQRLAHSSAPILRLLCKRAGLAPVPSILHMMANRVFPSRARSYELLLSRTLRDRYRRLRVAGARSVT